MIGDLWVLVTRLEDPRRDGVPVTEPPLFALTAPANMDSGNDGADGAESDRGAGSDPGAPQVDGLIPIDRVEWDAWRAAADRYLTAVHEASATLATAERRAGRAAARLLPGARRRATVAACALAAADYVARVRAATTAYWPIHCEISRRLESQTAARRWLAIRGRFAGDGTEPVWGWSLRELEPSESPGLVELTVFRWDSRPETRASAADFVSPGRFGAQDLDRELLRLRATWTVRRIVWDEAARHRVEQGTDGIPFALWWRAVTTRVDADEKVVPPRSAASFAAPPAARTARRIEVLQLPEQIPDQLPEQGDGL